MKKILIVDDEDEIRASITEMLINMQYEVYGARNGKEALVYVESQKPDLVISDILMPVMDGIKLLETLRSKVSTDKIPFIVLSAKTSGSNKDYCLSKGANEFLNKPFNALDLYDAVARNINPNK